MQEFKIKHQTLFAPGTFPQTKSERNKISFFTKEKPKTWENLTKMSHDYHCYILVKEYEIGDLIGYACCQTETEVDLVPSVPLTRIPMHDSSNHFLEA